MLRQYMATDHVLLPCNQSPFLFNSKEEEELCAMTAGFEDFVCQFFDRCFTLVENSTLEATRMDKNKDEKRNRMDILGERALVSVVTSVLMQSSPEIFQAALSKLTPFVTDRIMETTVGGRTIAVICGAFARVHSVETLKMLLPRLLDKILAITESEEVCKDFDIDDELHYNLLVLSRVSYQIFTVKKLKVKYPKGDTLKLS